MVIGHGHSFNETLYYELTQTSLEKSAIWSRGIGEALQLNQIMEKPKVSRIRSDEIELNTYNGEQDVTGSVHIVL